MVSMNVLDAPSQGERHVKHYTPQEPRLQVRVSTKVKELLQPLYDSQTRKATPIIGDLAEKIGLREALRLLANEPRHPGSNKTLAVALTPSNLVLERARSFDLSPHVLIRAAAVKLALELEATEGDVEEALAALNQVKVEA